MSDTDNDLGMGPAMLSSNVFLDESGAIVPPEEETSWLMAHGIIPHDEDDQQDEGGTGNVNSIGGGIAHEGRTYSSLSARAEDGSLRKETPFTQDSESFERERKSASERLSLALQLEEEEERSCYSGGGANTIPSATGGGVPHSALSNTSTYQHTSSSANVSNISVGREGGGKLRDQANEGSMIHEGMDEYGAPSSFSRELTADEDEWVLERLIRRRVIRPGGLKRAAAADRDYATFYDDFGSKSSGMMGAGWVEYLCKWKGYNEATWEKRDLMVDEGYLRECNQFDEKVLGSSVALSGKSVIPNRHEVYDRRQEQKKRAAAAAALAKGKDDDDSSSSITDDEGEDRDERDGFGGFGRVVRNLYNGAIPPGAPGWFAQDDDQNRLDQPHPHQQKRKKHSENATSFGNSRPIEALAGISEWDIKTWFRKDDMKAIRYGTVARQNQIDQFIQTYQRLQKTHRPVVLFHGTQAQNLPSIAERGLRVPVGRNDVVNGAAYGLGIYAAFYPAVASVYCWGNRNNFGGKATQRFFICVGLVSPTDPDVTVVDHFCTVFRRPELIIPLLIVDVCRGYTHRPHLTRRHYTLENLLPVQKESMSEQEYRRGQIPHGLAVGLSKATNQNVASYKRAVRQLEEKEGKGDDASGDDVVLEM